MRTVLLALSMIGAFTMQAQDRVEKQYYANGALRSIYGTDDDRSWFVNYHENGQVKEKGSFYHGALNGTWKQFDDHGNLLTRARFADGKRDGNWKFGNAMGEITLRLRYRNNELVHGAQFDQRGELVAERDLR